MQVFTYCKISLPYIGEISPTRCNNCVFYSQWLYSWWWVRLSPETCRVKPLRIKNAKKNEKNAIVASCWTYFTNIKHDARNHKYWNLSTCFGCSSHPSSGVHKTVTAVSGTGHNIWATTFLQRGLTANWPHEAEWTPFQTHYYSENLVAPGIEPETSVYLARNSDH